MSNNQLKFLVGERKQEDDKDVRHIVKNIGHFSNDRLIRMINSATLYENKYGGNRGNRNVIRAVEVILNQQCK